MGVSGVVDADGTVREKTGMWKADARVAGVGLHTHLTPAVRWGGPMRLAWNLAAGATTALALWQTRRLPQRRGRRKYGWRRRGLPSSGGDGAQRIPSESRTESVGSGNIRGKDNNKEER